MFKDQYEECLQRLRQMIKCQKDTGHRLFFSLNQRSFYQQFTLMVMSDLASHPSA